MQYSDTLMPVMEVPSGVFETARLVANVSGRGRVKG